MNRNPNRLIYLSAVLVLCIFAFAAQARSAEPYASMQDAASAGMSACLAEVSPNVECGFGVYRVGDTYQHTQVQAGSTDKAIDGMRLSWPKSATLVAFGHTHPRQVGVRSAEDTSDMFSAGDVQFAKATGLHMFMRSAKTGALYHFKHGASKTSTHSQLGRVARGEIVTTGTEG